MLHELSQLHSQSVILNLTNTEELKQLKHF